MNMIVTAAFIVVLFVFFIVAERTGLPFGKWVAEKWRTFSQKFVVAFMLGFILFAFISRHIPTWPQKLGLSALAVLLILANSIHLPFHKEC